MVSTNSRKLFRDDRDIEPARLVLHPPLTARCCKLREAIRLATGAGKRNVSQCTLRYLSGRSGCGERGAGHNSPLRLPSFNSDATAEGARGMWFITLSSGRTARAASACRCPGCGDRLPARDELAGGVLEV